LLCNGATPLRASAIDLFAAISTTWGTGNGSTTFTIPNGYSQSSGLGSFLRSSTSAVAVGTYQANQNLAHTHTVTGAPTISSLTTDSQGAHVHTITDPGHVHTLNNNAYIEIPYVSGSFWNGGSAFGYSTLTMNSAVTGISINSAGAHTHTVTGTLALGSLATASSGGSGEARPEALTALMCIRY
jgi:hypothetical protein